MQTENNPSANDPIGEGLTFEKVWVMFQETDRRRDELNQKFKEEMAELRESQKKTDKQMKETDRKIGELGNRFGKLAEHLVAPGIMEKFNKKGFNFTRCSNAVLIKEAGNPDALAEIDIMLENGEIVIAVEVKASAKPADVDKFVKRMELLRRTADQRPDTRKYQGAVAVAIMNQSLRDYILQSGFYAIEQTGDTVKLTIPKGFVPREW